MSKYTQKYEYFENKHCIFFGPNMAASQLASLDILNTKRVISPQNEKVSEAQILSGLYWEYICFVGKCRLTYLKIAQKVVMCREMYFKIKTHNLF